MIKINKKLNKMLFLIVLVGINIFLLSFFEFGKDIDLEIKGIDKIYLALGESKKIELDIMTVEEGNFVMKYESSDTNIASVDENGNVIAKNQGTTIIKAKCLDKEKDIEVIVTDLITPPVYSQNKESLTCEVYNNEEAMLLDKILKYDIETAGYGTRAGVVAAARFLTLKFQYKINYYFENGRLDSTTRKYIDGEGRYYHEGLYLSKSKYDTLKASTKEPKMWGCELYANYTKSYSRNGLNCSGFITWTLLNGGFDIGDIGAGITDEYDLTELGSKVDISLDVIKQSIKVGDLIGRDGHIAIIIGIDEEKIYIAESYIPSLKVREFTYEELVKSNEFDYVMLMDDVYISDGNLTNMWN